ncbi:MAG: DUF6531 domain-containing protein, partial [Bryobacteraceae bacterium]|nr:DUF6531 domain-containing protein [Bryobacteraceae bacterium]
MRTRWQWVVMGCALLCYAPAAPPEANHGPAAASATQAGQNSGPGPKIRADASPAEVYRRVKAIAEEYLRPHWPRPAEVWRRPWNHEQAFAEFRGLDERVRSLESVRGGLPLVGSGGASRIFAGWQRLKVEGVETACETDAAPAPRGGPEDEVVLGTGEVVLAQTDLSLPARGGVGFSLVRYYRSQVDYNGPLGPGWDHSCNQRIVAEGRASAPHSLVWYTGQRAIRFTRQGDDWQPEPGAFYRLQMEGRQVVVETPERMRLEFEPARERGPGGQGWRIARIAGRHDRWQANVMKFQY